MSQGDKPAPTENARTHQPMNNPQRSRMKWVRAGSFFFGLIITTVVVFTEQSGKATIYSLSGLGILGLLLWLSAHNSTPRQANFRLWAKVTLVAVAVLFSAVLAEIGLRCFWRRDFVTTDDEHTLLYRYDPELGWFPQANGHRQFKGWRSVYISHNGLGFRAAEFVKRNVPGIVFLGDSFVWGYDVEAEERFTDKLQARHPEWDIYNFGVSGYGTDQEFLLLQKYFDLYKPRLVFLVICAQNDILDNQADRKGGYFKPYFSSEAGHLTPHRIPVPRSERVFCVQHPILARSWVIRLAVRAWCAATVPAWKCKSDPTFDLLLAVKAFVEQHGAKFAAGLTAPWPEVEQLLRTNHVPCLDLSTPERYPAFGEHWTPAGHAFVCNEIERWLTNGNYLPQFEPPPGEQVPHAGAGK
jgi:hypothetical protein